MAPGRFTAFGAALLALGVATMVGLNAGPELWVVFGIASLVFLLWMSWRDQMRFFRRECLRPFCAGLESIREDWREVAEAAPWPSGIPDRDDARWDASSWSPSTPQERAAFEIVSELYARPQNQWDFDAGRAGIRDVCDLWGSRIGRFIYGTMIDRDVRISWYWWPFKMVAYAEIALAGRMGSKGFQDSGFWRMGRHWNRLFA